VVSGPGTRFTLAAPGTPPPPAATPAKSPLAPLGGFRRDWTSPAVYEVVEATTADGLWVFVRVGEETWNVLRLPEKTVVKAGLRSQTACRRYVGAGKAQADLDRLLAAKASAA
jgi:hypothetical protein